MAVMDWVAVMLDEDRRRRMAGEDGGQRIMQQSTAADRPTPSLPSDSTDFGRWKQRNRSHINNAPKPDLLERWMIGVAYKLWKGGCDEQKEMCGCRDGMSPRRRRRLHFSRLPACDPTSSQCLVSIHRLLNYFRLTLPPLQSSLFASLLTWLQSSESE